MIRVIHLSFLIFLISETADAQIGYVKFYDSDSIQRGYIRFTQSATQERKLEIWRTKNDKDPSRVSLEDIAEYSLGKDTFRVIRNFQPFEGKDIFFDLAEAEIVVPGPVELLSVINPYYSHPMMMVYPNGSVGAGVTIDRKTNQRTILALHERRNGYIRAVNEKVFSLNTNIGNVEHTKLIREVVEDFFPAAAIDEYEKVNKKKLTDKNLKKFMLDYKAKKLNSTQ